MVNNKIKKIFGKTGKTIVLSILIFGASSCEKSRSYSELLKDEQIACNWYLSTQNVSLNLPEDPHDLITFEDAGEDAPFYKLDEDGYVYMQVIKADFDEMVEEGDLVYFRFSRENLLYMYKGITGNSSGNSDQLSYGSTSFSYKNTTIQSSTTWGTGIQMPLKYLGYNSEVNLVLKSYYGFLDEQSSCVPYLINLRYFKPEY